MGVLGEPKRPAVHALMPPHAALESSMEDNIPSPSHSDALSARSATALRELNERARAAMAAQQGQMSRLEADISAKLEAITAAIAEQQAIEADENRQSEQARAELARHRQEIDAARAEWQRERAEQEAALEKRHKELEARGGKQDERSKQLGELGCDLESRQAALDEQTDALAKREAAIEEQQAALAEREAAIDQREAAIKEREAAIDERAESLKSARTEQAADHEDLAEREAAWNTERAALEASRDELAEKLVTLEALQQGSQDQWQDQLAGFERKLHEQQSSWSDQRAGWDKTQAELEHDQDEMRQKFELALQDVQRFRGRAAELEQELARRPEASQADSAELIALRAERDALAQRVDALERLPVDQIDASTEQQIADLQRRFELAVEDVRELKTKNAELEKRLAAAASIRPSGQPDVGGMDWESQKRRMLASLEGDADEGDEACQKQRASIENTIEMTDAVVAEKDREIQELKTRLATAASEKADEGKVDEQEKVDELLDADQVIAEHRKRIAQMEREMEDKLRAAELELSVERAKMGRQKAELEELRNDLESQRQSQDTSGPGGVAGAPRRRWLSKLGLSGEEQP